MATLRGPQDILMDSLDISMVLSESQQERTKGATLELKSKEPSEVDASDKVC